MHFHFLVIPPYQKFGRMPGTQFESIWKEITPYDAVDAEIFQGTGELPKALKVNSCDSNGPSHKLLVISLAVMANGVGIILSLCTMIQTACPNSA